MVSVSAKKRNNHKVYFSLIPRNVDFVGSLSTVVGLSQLRSRKDKFCPFFFDVQSDENPFFEVFKVPKTKGISFDEFNEIISHF